MNIQFTKMHGLGNDFVMLDAINQPLDMTPALVRYLADRRFGIGCDQVLLVESATRADADFRYRIFNADGSQAGQCGNGARCFARFVKEKGLSDKTAIPVEVDGGLITLFHEDHDLVTVDMGAPILTPDKIPFIADKQNKAYDLSHEGQTYTVGAVSMGNPHVVLRVEDVSTAPVESLGPGLESHPRFPERVNVGFMQILNSSQIKLRVFERGSGETLACGTGACAAMVAGRLQGWLDDTVQVELPGGGLRIHWQEPGTSVRMTGPATTVFDGHLSWNSLS